MKPFLGILLWSIILAVALFPVVEVLAKKFHISRKKMVITMALAANIALVVPTYFVSDKAIDSISKLKVIVEKDNLSVPMPQEKVKEIPLVGEKIYTMWEGASKDLAKSIEIFTPQIKLVAAKTVKLFGDILQLILVSMVSIIIAMFLIIHAEKYAEFYKKIFVRLIGEKGDEWAHLTALTIRSVASGVIGVAVIQAGFALLGLVMMDIPFSLLIAVAVMFLTIVQLPALIAIGPVIVYVLSQDTSTGAIIFTVYMLIVGAMDGVLKPLLMGRGVDIPMLVVLVGAIGGMILMGMIGLFLGAVIFALAYKLVMLWLDDSLSEA